MDSSKCHNFGSTLPIYKIQTVLRLPKWDVTFETNPSILKFWQSSLLNQPVGIDTSLTKACYIKMAVSEPNHVWIRN